MLPALKVVSGPNCLHLPRGGRMVVTGETSIRASHCDDRFEESPPERAPPAYLLRRCHVLAIY